MFRKVKVGTGVRSVQSMLSNDGCNETVNCVNRLEHVAVRITFSYKTRGFMTFTLTSPSGTVSQLLTARNADTDTNGQLDWTFMSVQFWGEDPVGTWLLNFTVAHSSESGKSYGDNLYLIISYIKHEWTNLCTLFFKVCVFDVNICYKLIHNTIIVHDV